MWVIMSIGSTYRIQRLAAGRLALFTTNATIGLFNQASVVFLKPLREVYEKKMEAGVSEALRPGPT